MGMLFSLLMKKIIKPSLVLFIVVTMMLFPLTCIGMILSIAYPFLPKKTYSKVAAWCQNQFLLSFVYLYERNHSGLHIHVSGDELPSGENALLISNHVASHGDWAPLYSLIARQSPTALGGFKCVVKDVIKWVPGFGACMWLLEWPFLKRNWAGDKIYLENKLKGYGTTNNELTMVIFPEGTRWTVKKHADAVKYANERKLHVPVHTMIPRYKGFQALVRGLDGVATHVYDVTLAYNNFDLSKGSKGPGYFALYQHDSVQGTNPVEFHVHVRRLKLSDLPKDDDELKIALFQWFEKKDKLLTDFYNSKEKKFEHSKQLQPLPASQWVPAVSMCMAMASICGHVCLYGMHWW